jgi:hypothetical protein
MSPRILALVGLAALAVVTAVAVVAGRDDGRGAPVTSSEPVRVELGGRPLAVPANAIRFADQRAAGPRTRLDLALSWPELEGRTEATAARFDTPDLPLDILFVTLQPRVDAWDSATRLAAVYARFFVGEPWAGPGGLQGRRLSPKSGYADEVIWLEPGVVRPFVARCFPLAPGQPPKMCLHDVVHGSLLVTLWFPEALLGEWHEIDAALDVRLAGWGVEVR